MFKTVKVKSSAIKTVSYNPESRILRIEFTQGREYDYPDVPEIEFKNLIGAESVGKYYNQHIKSYSIVNR